MLLLRGCQIIPHKTNHKHGFCNHILERSEFINIHDLVNLAPAKEATKEPICCDQILILEQVNLIFRPATSQTAHDRLVCARDERSAVPGSPGRAAGQTLPGNYRITDGLG